MPHMRTAQGALDYIRSMDPGTAITLRYIRRLISSGTIPCTQVGRKRLVDTDILIDYISGSRKYYECEKALKEIE